MRLMLLTQDYPPAVGGIQTYAHALARQFAGRVGQDLEDFRVVAPRQPGDEAVDGVDPWPVHRIPATSDLMRLTALPWVLALTRRHKTDTVLTGHWYVAAAALAARRMGLIRKVYVAAHAQELIKDPVPGPLQGAYRRHRRAVLLKADGCFPVSRYTGDLLTDLGVAPERVHVVPNGTDVAWWRALPLPSDPAADLRRRFQIPEGPMIATVARLVPRKGVDTVLDALPQIIKAHPTVQYVIAGGGPAEADLKARAAALGVADRCHFLGRVPVEDLAALYSACAAFVMPARQEGPSVEGFGLVFREANLFGRPAVGARSGGVPDAIEHEQTGLLVPPDDPAAVAQALDRLLSDPAYADQLGAQGRDVVLKVGDWRFAADRILACM